MPDYQNGKIYTIRCRSDNTLIYVGSTITTLSRRLAEHKSKSKKYNTRKIYQSINDNWDDWYIELYEVYPCENKEQLNKREGEITREIGTLNSAIAGRTKKEYYENNIDKMKLYKQEYYQINAEKLKLINKEYRENNIDKIKLYHQEYRENNIDKKKLTDKEYRENNAEKIKGKITCECGCIIRKYGLPNHLKTKRHIEGINPV